MKKIIFTIIALVVTIAVSAQTIKVYEYDDNGNLNSVPAYQSSKEVKVIFTDKANDIIHEYVDLGLPSGTLWATCNIGAESPSENGLYFSWGDIEGHTSDYDFSWENYKYCNRSMSKLTKYTYQQNPTRVGDYTTDLDYCDDAAYMLWGHDWEMPTNYQIGELINNCCWVLTNDYNGTGTSGCIAYKAKSEEDKGKRNIDGKVANEYTLNDCHIFFPEGEIWSRILNTEERTHGFVMNINSNQGVMGASTARDCGLNIRPVRFR